MRKLTIRKEKIRLGKYKKNRLSTTILMNDSFNHDKKVKSNEKLFSISFPDSSIVLGAV
jgi:hypothetical protein